MWRWRPFIGGRFLEDEMPVTFSSLDAGREGSLVPWYRQLAVRNSMVGSTELWSRALRASSPDSPRSFSRSDCRCHLVVCNQHMPG